MAKTQDELVGLFETIRDRMMGSEISMVQTRFKELDDLIEGKSEVKYQAEVLNELDVILTGVLND